MNRVHSTMDRGIVVRTFTPVPRDLCMIGYATAFWEKRFRQHGWGGFVIDAALLGC